ncbi:MAG: heme ABC transporter permease [Legionellales bacterium RIFCSPHIGHO2_12_FULL_42_9]|nr:MAG: heme ABC transporter permease [Legionellales bacterium RIFCSPHIGHO2_12_FULL_42_9]
MWRFLYQLAVPKNFYYQTQSILTALGFGALLFLLVGIGLGLFWAPPDYQQGDAFRIIYVHVPAAFLSLTLYTAMGFLAVLLLIWRIKLAGLMLTVVAQLGASMAFLALVTGSIWGKPMWGTWWIWDARLTSELILFLLYLAILATECAFEDPLKAEKVIAILTLVGLIDLPIIHYSVYWWNTLHQGATLSLFAKPKIASVMFYPLLVTLIGFSLFCVWVVLHQTRTALLLRERRQRWVLELVSGEKG